MLTDKQPEIIQVTETISPVEVGLEQYMEMYAEYGYEWVDAKAIKLLPIGLRHENIRDYLRSLLKAYFVLRLFHLLL